MKTNLGNGEGFFVKPFVQCCECLIHGNNMDDLLPTKRNALARGWIVAIPISNPLFINAIKLFQELCKVFGGKRVDNLWSSF